MAVYSARKKGIHNLILHGQLHQRQSDFAKFRTCPCGIAMGINSAEGTSRIYGSLNFDGAQVTAFRRPEMYGEVTKME